MSISDLFNNKRVSQETFGEITGSIESPDLVKEINKKNKTFFPNVNFADPSTFVHFGSAKEYYSSAIKRIYETYPYDGSEKEKLQFENDSTYLDQWLYDNKYPKSTGYAIFTAGLWGSPTSTVGKYGTPANIEYIYSPGGLHSASLTQHTLPDPIENYDIAKVFDKGVKYNSDKNRTINYRMNMTDGITIQFWLKKDAFTTTGTDKEVILDLWNGNQQGAHNYGRLTLEISGGLNLPTTGSAIYLTLMSGTYGIHNKAVCSASYNAAALANSTWTHHSFTIKSNSTNLFVKYFQNGVLSHNATHATSVTLGDIPDNINGYIGSLQTASFADAAGPSYPQGMVGGGKLSASMDDFRFWKKALNEQYIYNTWNFPIGGGANTDDYRTDLGVYYKFNEGVVGDASYDSIVLDYSGRVSNGSWIGYSATSRNTGSAYVSSSALTSEPGDPIIRLVHPDVQTLITEMNSSGSLHDRTNSSYLYNSIPGWLREEDEKNNNIQYLFQILSSYLDTLYVQISELPKLKDKNYFSASAEPYFFVDRVLGNKGLITPNSFVETSVLEYFWNRDNSGNHYEQSIEKTKRIIYNNIYNNLDYILKTKGTEKSFRNLLRCYGVDDELVKLNVYTDNGTHYLKDRYKNSSVKTKTLNFDNGSRIQASVTQNSSSTNSFTFISGSGHKEKLERNSAFSIETGITFPKKNKFGEIGYYADTSISSSLFGFHQAFSGSTYGAATSTAEKRDYVWNTPDNANLQVYCVKSALESSRAKFVVTNQDESVFMETDFYDNIYDNRRWSFQLSVEPVGYPFIFPINLAPEYQIRLYGVSHTLGVVEDEVDISTKVSDTIGQLILSEPKRVYLGAHRTNFTGSAIVTTNVMFDSYRVWLDKLSDEAIKQHNLDPLNYGHNKLYDNTTPFDLLNSSSVEVPAYDSLILHWNFDQNTTASAAGQLDVQDFSSGSTGTMYGWLSNVIERENKGLGIGFPANEPEAVTSEFIFARRKELPEISFTDDRIVIMDEEKEYFLEDEDISDNVYALEKSMYQVISEDMLRTFSTMKEYANLFSKPVDLYRMEYKKLRRVRNLFFGRVQENADLDKYVDYFKWIDSSLSFFVEQLKPASVTFTKGISDVVESHVFERPKYDRKFPTLERKTATEGVVKGLGERIYNWKLGHSPIQTTATATIVVENAGGVFHGDTFVLIDSVGTSTTYTINGGVAQASGGGSGGSATVGFAGVGGGSAGKVAAANAIAIAINGTTDANYTAVSDGVDTVTITQGTPGSAGNRTNTDSISATTVSNFTGGDTKENTHVLWQKTRAERQGPIASEIQKISDIVQTQTNTYNVFLGDNSKNIYLRQNHIHRAYSRQYTTKTELQNVIHGGINYNLNKDRDFVFNVVRPHGAKTNLGVPVNVLTVGVAEGKGIFSTVNNDDVEVPNKKKKHAFKMIAGKDSSGDGSAPATASLDYVYEVKGHFGSPFNVMSGSVAVGANKSVYTGYHQDSIFTNLHSDTTYFQNDVPLQGPFTETWVGGHQSRHVGINKYDPTLVTEGGGPTLNNLHDEFSRPEAWRLVFGEHPDEIIQDGAFGLVGPDYGGPYPDPSRQWAIYYRDTRAKKPYNIGNISGSDNRLGNYHRNYEYFNSVGRLENNTRLKKAASNSEYQISGAFLPSQIQAVLPATTNPLTLVSIAPSSSGNVFGQGESNRINDALELVGYSGFSTGSFEVTGATIYNSPYTGSFRLQPPPVAPQVSFLSFTVATGSSLANADVLQITGSGVNKQIEVDTAGSGYLSDTDIVLPTYRQALRANSTANATAADTSYSGLNSSGFSLSFWVNNGDSSGTNQAYILFRTGTNTRHYIRIYDDMRIYFENSAGGNDFLEFDTNSQTVSGSQWMHVVAVFEVDDLSDNAKAPKLWANGSQVTSSGGSSYTAPGAGTPTINDIIVQLDDSIAFQDVTIWNTLFTGSEAVSQLYNGGVWKDPTTHASASSINDYYKFGEEYYWNDIGYKAGDTLDDIGGSINRFISSSYGTGNNSLEIDASDDQNFLFIKGKGDLTNDEIWNKLTSSLDVGFPGWDATYISGSENAKFFLQKDSPGSNTVELAETGTSFDNLHSGSGANAVTSNLLDKEAILIGTTQITASHTTSGSNSSFQTATSYRKALRFKDIGSDVETNAYNESYTNPTSEDYMSISWWMKTDEGSGFKRIWEFDNGSSNHSFAYAQNDDLFFIMYDGVGNDYYRWVAANIYSSLDYYPVVGSGQTHWTHYTFVWDRRNPEGNTPVFYINGVPKTLSFSSQNGSRTWGSAVPFNKVYIGGNDSADQEQQDNGLQDFVVWNTRMTEEGAQILYNSGSWYDIHAHPSASYIWDWWMLGNEDNIGQASGSALSTGTAVTSLSPKIGRHDLAFNNNANVYVTDGIAETLKTATTFWSNFDSGIDAATPYTATNVSNSSGYSVFTLNAEGYGLNTTLSASHVSPAGSTAFTNISGITKGSQYLTQPVGGAIDNEYIQLGSTRFIIDSDNSNAGGNFAKVGDHYYVYSSGSTTSAYLTNTFWTRLSGAIFQAFPNYAIYFGTETLGAANTKTTFHLTASVGGFSEDRAITESGTSFTIVSPKVTGSTAVYDHGLLNVTQRESDYLTGSIRNRTVIASRFSAPGGVEIQTYGYLDAYAREYSVHNSLNYRNLSVRGSGSGEEGTIRANSQANTRDGLRTLYQRPMGRGGVDSVYETVDDTDYNHTASFHKVPRNTLVTPRSGSSEVEIVEKQNNYNYNSILPASDYNYSWATSSLGDNYSVRSGNQKVFGYWPKDGLNTVNGVLDSAITFPTASEIYGE